MQGMVSKEQTQISKVQIKCKSYKERLLVKKDELNRAKRDFEDILNERNEEVTSIKDQLDLSMREFLSKGEKAAFLTRDLIYKINSLRKLFKEEKRLVNFKLIGQAIKEVTSITDKIYDNVKIYDVTGKLVTIDLQSIEVTQQQQTMDLQNESSICNFYNNAAFKKFNDPTAGIIGVTSFSGGGGQVDKKKNTIITNQQ